MRNFLKFRGSARRPAGSAVSRDRDALIDSNTTVDLPSRAAYAASLSRRGEAGASACRAGASAGASPSAASARSAESRAALRRSAAALASATDAAETAEGSAPPRLGSGWTRAAFRRERLDASSSPGRPGAASAPPSSSSSSSPAVVASESARVASDASPSSTRTSTATVATGVFPPKVRRTRSRSAPGAAARRGTPAGRDRSTRAPSIFVPNLERSLTRATPSPPTEISACARLIVGSSAMITSQSLRPTVYLRRDRGRRRGVRGGGHESARQRGGANNGNSRVPKRWGRRTPMRAARTHVSPDASVHVFTTRPSPPSRSSL